MPENPELRVASSEATPVAFIRKVGRGKTLSKDLTFDESRFAFALLLQGRFTPAQAGAFLQALRIKELSQDELNGLVAALHEGMPSVASPMSGGVTLNLASDTPRKGGMACLLAALCLAKEGRSIGVVRGDPLLSGNEESFAGTVRAFAEAEGDPILPVSSVYDVVPDLRKLRTLRQELGFRSCLHTAEKMLQPWPQSNLLLGISHRHYAERMVETLRHRGCSGKIVLGNHGTPDLNLHKETEVWEVSATGDIRMIFVHPDDLGIKPDPVVYTLGFFPEWPGEMKKAGHGLLGPVLKYHLAFLRYAAGDAKVFSTHQPTHGAA